jgi:uncharacterized delta-60 repeat protein
MSNDRYAPDNPLGLASETLAAGVRLAGARYTLKRLLGRGDFSEVWLAWDRQLEQEVALKLLPPVLLENSALIERLRQETRRNVLLTHPVVARVFDFVPDHQLLAIAIEHIDGWSLATLKVDRPKQRFSPEEIMPWLRQLCAALDYAHHTLYLVHRGLRPANLLLDPHEQIKVTDFAIAHTVHSALLQRGYPAGGAIAYQSPQQLEGAEASVLDDVYSLGATLYDLLTGAPPFFKGDLAAQVRESSPPGLAKRLAQLGIRDSLPTVWDDVVAACLAKNPANRPQSAGEVFESLQRDAAPKPVEQSESAVDHASRLLSELPAAELRSGEASPESRKAFVPSAAAPVAAAQQPQPLPAGFRPTTESGATETASGMNESPPAAATPALPKSRWAKPAGLIALTILALMAGVWLAPYWKGPRLNPPKPGSKHSLPGSLDTTFNAGSGSGGDLRSLAVQPDGKILAGGRFKTFDDVPLQGIVRLDANGGLETTFSPRLRGAVQAIALQPDGKIVIGGDFMSVDGHRRARLARLNVDGSLDSDFDPGGALNRDVRALLVQSDGRILAGGSFDAAGGRRHNRITRLNANGTRDGSFNPGSGASKMVWALALQADGKILVAGDFPAFNDRPCGHLARLQADGSFDSSFQIGSGADGPVLGLYVQDNGKILLGGKFAFFNGIPRNHLARLNPDGTVDVSFDVGIGSDGGVRSLAVQPGGKIIIGGAFAAFQGIPRSHVARLNANGGLDPTYDPGYGAADGDIWCLALQPDLKVIVAGVFRTFDNVDSGHIARLNGE